MIRRIGYLSVLAGAILGGSRVAPAQTSPDGSGNPASPRIDLPFSTPPDQLSGPPRAMGELFRGDSQPPSTLPGNLFGPPRAMGEAPGSSVSDFPQGFLPPIFRGSGPGSGMSSGLGEMRLPSMGTSAGGVLSPFTGSFMSSPLGRPGQAPSPTLPPALTEQPARPKPRKVRPLVAGDAPPLSLDETLAATEQSYPPFRAILEEAAIAAGDLLSARGAFDLNLNMDSRNYPLGYYRRSVHDVFLEQPTTLYGAKFFAGYRNGYGNYPTYYQYLETRGGGAFVAGLELPLLQNGRIDAKRAKLYQTEIERRKVEPTIAKERVSLFKNTAKLYWNWVAAGQSASVFRDLMANIRKRNAGFEEQVKAGALRSLDLYDIQRLFLSKQQSQIAAERRFQQATIELSLFLRDAEGMPIMPEAARLPIEYPATPAPDFNRFREDCEIAHRLRPELRSLALVQQKAQVEREYAQNQMLPKLNFYMYNEQNVGDPVAQLGKDNRPYIMESSLLFDVPIQRRYARGRVQVANAELRQISLQRKFASERVTADVQDAYSALQAAYEQVERYREYEQLTFRLEEAEASLLASGGSTILVLALREQASFDAILLRVEAEAKYFSALAEYRAALGLDAVPGELLTPR